ncbi:MAG: aconitate hydratase, partial [Clostridia bacterium]|nr:aconitate hydratase [Clostridia bacterium]
VGKVMEYIGEGVKTLTVPERATIANMGAELGATTSVFPSDEVTRAFLKAQGREADFRELAADADAEYDDIVDIDLNPLEPLVAQPHMPDNVDTVKNIGPIKVDQVFIGSCTNSSYQDMMRVARILKGKTVHPDVSLVIGPGSKQVLTMLARNGALADMLGAGARILESACGPCIGMGQSPKTNAVSVRTNNRNFYARSGTASAGIYLTSCETAAVTALTGVLTDPRTLDLDLTVEQPKQFEVNDNLVIPPVAEGQEDTVDVVRGPNIKPFPLGHDLENEVTGKVLLKMEDNITTDHIMPSNAKLLPFRSNIPHLADFCLTPVDETFPARAKEEKGGILVAGANYGQGSSREHAALVPLYLGIRAVAAKSFARIHQANLINNGILPLTFADEKDYDRIDQGDTLSLPGVREKIEAGEETLVLKNETKNETYAVKMPLTERQKGMILAGGLINYIRSHS